jgi:ADP-ribose pyrophosphatase YjhB (NUDIX family)
MRECQEETGLVITDLELLSAKQYTDDFRGHGINLAYRARVKAGTVQAGDDAQFARWFSCDELPPPNQIAFAGHAAILEYWRSSVCNSSDWLRE